MGMGSVIRKMRGPRFGSDIDCSLINMWKWAVKGWVPPTNISREQFYAGRGLPKDHPLRAFIGYECAFGAKFFASYAQSQAWHAVQNYAEVGSRALVKAAEEMKGVELCCQSYDKLNPENAVLYLDPPYAGHAKVHQYGDMNYQHFFLWASGLAMKGNIVLVSGYSYAPYPSNFEIVYSVASRIGMKGPDIESVTECLFRVNPPTKAQVQEIQEW